MCSFVKATVCFMELSVCCHIIAVSLQTYIRALSVITFMLQFQQNHFNFSNHRRK